MSLKETMIYHYRQFNKIKIIFLIFKVNAGLYQDLKLNLDRLASLKVRAHINILNQKNKDEGRLKKDMEKMNIEGNAKKNENLFQYIQRAQKNTEDNGIPEDLENLSLIDFPPNYSLLPSKPIFLDLVH